MAAFFKALANPHRVALFEQLASCCAPGTSCPVEEATVCVGELGETMDIARSTLSHHLKELNQAGLIQMQRQGKQVLCSVNPDVLRELSTYFSSKQREES